MNRTKRLMTAVTTSILLAGTAPMYGAYVPARQQEAPPQDESWKTDQRVQDAANTISPALHGKAAAQAMTQEDIAKLFPTLSSALIGNALKLLVWQAEIKRMGDGSKDNPFKYFEMSGHEG